MYYFWANDAQAGPYTLNQVRAMWNSGQINPTTLYWQEGMANWSSLSDILQIIEEPTTVRGAPRILETRQPQDKKVVPIASVYQWLLYLVFCFALISFFLPNISLTMPIVGTTGVSMFDLITSKPSDASKDASNSTESNSQGPTAPNFWDDITGNKIGAGGIICAISLFLLMGHYLLTLVWGFLTFVLKRNYAFLTFIWLCLAVQFPILFLIGGQILIGGMKSQMTADLANNPFAVIGEAMAASIGVQPGLTTWILMILSLAALIFYKVFSKPESMS
jgi:GYF domain 2